MTKKIGSEKNLAIGIAKYLAVVVSLGEIKVMQKKNDINRQVFKLLVKVF